MTRIVTTAAAILILTIAIGCESNTGISQQLPQTNKSVCELLGAVASGGTQFVRSD